MFPPPPLLSSHTPDVTASSTISGLLFFFLSAARPDVGCGLFTFTGERSCTKVNGGSRKADKYIHVFQQY